MDRFCSESSGAGLILCSDPRSQYLSHKNSVDAAIRSVIDSGWYVLGTNVSGFEEEFSRYIGVRHGVGVGSGTEALHLALVACGIGDGDEVITVSHTAVATVTAIEMSGAIPVLVDIDPYHFTLNPSHIEAALSPRTKAIIPVHLYGQSAELTTILEIARNKKIKVIEDCAQAHGATYQGRRVGSFGDLACFSFFPTKNLGGLGDGGMVVTDDYDIAQKVRSLREYGWRKDRISNLPGFNSRLDELQAAVLRAKLNGLDRDNDLRGKIASQYNKELGSSGLTVPNIRQDTTHVYHQYVIRSENRDSLKDFLLKRDIQTLIHYPVPAHMQPAYNGRLRGSDNLPITEQIVGEILSLPIYPELSKENQEFVISSILEFLS